MYTCRVRDYGMEQCASVYITVPTRPEITLFPMSVTVEKVRIFFFFGEINVLIDES